MQNKYLNDIIKIFLLASAYYITGRLGLLLTISSGQATAVWPPSGVALAGLLILGWRYWPGVLLGALGTSLTHPEVIDLQALLIALGIASGASLQAVTGFYLVRKYIKFPCTFEHSNDLTNLVFFGGLISCCINASIGTGILYSQGFLGESSVGFHWFTWWIGDTIGVIVFVPILLLVFSNNTFVSNSRKIIVSISLITAFLLTVYVFGIVEKQERQQQQIAFNTKAAEITSAFLEDVEKYIVVLDSIEAFYNASEYVSYEEFIDFTKNYIQKYPAIQALTWNQRVSHEQKPDFIEEIRDQGYPDFNIIERLDVGSFNAAEKREIYYPVTYIVPYQKNKTAHGYDTYSPDPVTNNLRQAILDAARDMRTVQTTGRISIVQAEDQYGLLFYHPIYDKNLKTNTVQDRRQYIIGYSAAVLVIPTMIQKVEALAKQIGAEIILKDLNADPTKQILFDSRTENKKQNLKEIPINPYALSWNSNFDIAGHIWSMDVFQSNKYLQETYPWILWAMLAGGFLFTGFVGIFLLIVTARTDVIQRLVDEKTEELRKSRNELQLIFDNVPVRIWFKDDKNGIIRLNKEAATSMGGSVKEFEGKNTYDLFPDIAKKYHDDDLKVINSNNPLQNIVEEYIPKDGPRGWVRTDKIPYIDPQTKERGIFVAAMDITQQKFQEDALFKEKEYNSFIVSSIPYLIINVNEDGYVHDANPKACQVFNLEKKEIIGMNLNSFWEDRHKKLFDNLLKGKKDRIEISYKAGDKEECVIEWRSLRQKINKTDTIDIFLFGEDITERILRERTERQANKMQALGHLAGGVAHELNNLMQPIILAGEILQPGLEENKNHSKSINMILRNADKASQIIDDILSFSHLDTPKKEKMNLQTTIDEAVNFASALLPKTVTIYQSGMNMNQSSYGYVNKNDLIRIMTNLLINASHAMDEKGIIRVSYSQEQKISDDMNESDAYPEDGYFKIMINDEGAGIPADIQEKIFNPFFTTKDIGKGTGMGLSIVYNILKSWDAHIDVESVVDVGTTFSIYIPITEID